MKVLIIGNNGQLGSTLVEIAKHETFASFENTGSKELDITDEKSVREKFNEIKPDFIINCSAYTAVVNAEFEEEQARSVNAFGPKHIGKNAASIGAGVIHISTDYVFDGSSNTPITPETKANPRSVYGKTKFEGEQLLLIENPKSIIIRTSWLYSSYGKNFFKTMLSLGSKQDEVDVVYDQVGSPTYAFDLANAIIHILKKTADNPVKFKPGTYHYSNEGVCSWYDFAQMIYHISGINCNVNPVRTDVMKAMVHRPAYSVLDKTTIIKQFGLSIPYWVDSLEACIKLTQQTK